jgi:predicted short-subunit dehydrogenase-like oxidoreductase (DUF2520 family)
MPNVLSIVGAGRVGRALGRCFHELGWKIGPVATTNESSARKAVRFIGAGRPFARISEAVLAAEVFLICTPDDAIGQAVSELAQAGSASLRGRIFLHTSGAQGSDAMQALKERGASVGSMHPLQSFSGVAVPSLEGRLFILEGDVQAVRVARRMARSLGGSPIRLATEKKPLYHAAAAMAAGQVLAVEEAAVQMFASLGIKRRLAVRSLLPLTRQVLDNFESLGPRSAWTGPLSRGDFKIVRAHLDALRDSPPEFAETYEVLNRLALRVLSVRPGDMLVELNKAVLQPIQKASVMGGKA